MPSAKDRARELGGGCFIKRNFTTKLPRTTLGAGLARTGTNTGKQKEGAGQVFLTGRSPSARS